MQTIGYSTMLRLSRSMSTFVILSRKLFYFQSVLSRQLPQHTHSLLHLIHWKWPVNIEQLSCLLWNFPKKKNTHTHHAMPFHSHFITYLTKYSVNRRHEKKLFASGFWAEVCASKRLAQFSKKKCSNLASWIFVILSWFFRVGRHTKNAKTKGSGELKLKSVRFIAVVCWISLQQSRTMYTLLYYSVPNNRKDKYWVRIRFYSRNCHS